MIRRAILVVVSCAIVSQLLIGGCTGPLTRTERENLGADARNGAAAGGAIGGAPGAAIGAIAVALIGLIVRRVEKRNLRRKGVLIDKPSPKPRKATT